MKYFLQNRSQPKNWEAAFMQCIMFVDNLRTYGTSLEIGASLPEFDLSRAATSPILWKMPLPETHFCCDQRPADKSLTGAQLTLASAPAQAKTRILFVDDEPAMLRVLNIGMRSMNGVWDMEFAASGEEGLALVQQKKFDVVVTDMRMAGINGAQL